MEQAMIETWKPVPGWPRFEVSDLGRVRSSSSRRTGWRPIKLRQNGPYWYVDFYQDGRRARLTVHSVVLSAFVGPRPEGMMARHFPDRDTSNNRLDNLSWGTKRENEDDKLVHGTIAWGELHGRRKLTAAQVESIRMLLSLGSRPIDCGAWFGVSVGSVCRIARGRSWVRPGSAPGAGAMKFERREWTRAHSHAVDSNVKIALALGATQKQCCEWFGMKFQKASRLAAQAGLGRRQFRSQRHEREWNRP